jgi:hypothetical protein
MALLDLNFSLYNITSQLTIVERSAIAVIHYIINGLYPIYVASLVIHFSFCGFV